MASDILYCPAVRSVFSHATQRQTEGTADELNVNWKVAPVEEADNSQFRVNISE